jgi:hypothetical protein
MVTRGIREFVSRDWAAARASKDAYWAHRIERLGPAEGLRMADELRRQMLSLNPDWPHHDDRRRDLLSHARVAGLLRRVHSTRGD